MGVPMFRRALIPMCSRCFWTLLQLCRGHGLGRYPMIVREHMTLIWSTQISFTVVADFNITLDQVNWLGNIVALVYLPTAFLIPYIVARYGLRRCVNILCSILLESATDATKFELGAVTLILSAWIRYAGTVEALSGQRAYALLMIGQVFISIIPFL